MENTLLETLNIEFKEIAGQKVVATMPVTPRVHQPFGILHGGASVALAETVASFGAYALVANEEKQIVGLEINANHLKAVKEGMLTAVGECIHQGRSTQVWEIKISNEKDQLICISRCTIAVLDRKILI